MAFVIALAAAVVLMPAGAWVGRRVGLVDRPSEDGLKIHRAPVPVTGGPTVLVVVAGVALALGVRWPWVAAAVCIAGAGGLLDDVRPVSPWVRLVVQGMAGIVLALMWLPALGLFGVAGVVLLTIACTNAVNIVDGQDGLAGGLGVLSAAGLAGLAMLVGAGSAAGVSLALTGALLGFLLWNRPPARIYLGDGGAYGVGTVMAALVVRILMSGGWMALPAAGLCLGVFAFELLFTVIRRYRLGRPITEGDRLHSYDLLSGRVGRRRSTAVFLALGTVTSLVGVGIFTAPPGWMALMAGLSAAVIGALWRPWPFRRGIRDEEPRSWRRFRAGPARPGSQTEREKP